MKEYSEAIRSWADFIENSEHRIFNLHTEHFVRAEMSTSRYMEFHAFCLEYGEWFNNFNTRLDAHKYKLRIRREAKGIGVPTLCYLIAEIDGKYKTFKKELEHIENYGHTSGDIDDPIEKKAIKLAHYIVCRVPLIKEIADIK